MDVGQFGIGMREVGGRRQRAAAEVPDEIVRRLGVRLAPRHQHHRLRIEQRDGVLVVRRFGAEEFFDLARLQVHFAQEGPVALGRGAGAAQEDRLAVVGGEQHRGALLGQTPQRIAGIVVPVFRREIEEHARLLARLVRIDDVDAALARRKPGLAHQRQVVVSPRDAAVAQRQLDQRRGLGVEGRFQHVDLIAVLGLGAGIAAVEGFGPVKCGRVVGAPVDRADAGGHRAESRGHAFGQRHVGNLLDQVAVEVAHFDAIGKAIGGHEVREGFMHRLDEHVFAARRRSSIGDQPRLADGRGRAVHRDAHQLRHHGMGEERFVVRVFEQILVRPRRCLLAEIFLDHRPGRRQGFFGSRPAIRRDGADEERPAVGDPFEGRPPEGIVHRRIHQPASLGILDAGYVEVDAVAPVDGEGEMLPVGRPAYVADPRVLGQAGDGPLVTPVEPAQGQAFERSRPAGSVVARVDADTGQAQLRLG